MGWNLSQSGWNLKHSGWILVSYKPGMISISFRWDVSPRSDLSPHINCPLITKGNVEKYVNRNRSLLDCWMVAILAVTKKFEPHKYSCDLAEAECLSTEKHLCISIAIEFFFFKKFAHLISNWKQVLSYTESFERF